MKIIKNRYITHPQEIYYNDGICISGDTSIEIVLIINCIIDFKNIELDEQDEAVICIQHPKCIFYNTIIRNAGKLFLCRKSAIQHLYLAGYVYILNCILDSFGRRAPEVHDNIRVYIKNTKISNWRN